MKILSFGFYDDFSSFFYDIEKANKGDYHHISSHLSGFLGYKGKKKSCLLFSRNKNVYDHLDSCLVFHRDEKYFSKNRSKYLKSASRYYDHFKEKIKEIEPDVVLISGDSKIPSKVLSLICKENAIKCFYFEQGPFRTTMIDPVGVNAFSSIAKNWDIDTGNSEKELVEKIQSFIKRKKNQRKKRKFWLRGLDFCLNLPLLNLLIPLDLREQNIIDVILDRLKLSIQKKTNKENPAKVSKEVLLALQVPHDANLIIHSPNYKNHAQILEETIRGLPLGWKVLVREHPLYKNGYESELYNIINQNKDVVLDQNLAAIDSIDRVDAIIVNNSMLGVESLLSNKLILALGNSYYMDVVTKVKDADEIRLALEENNILILKRLTFMYNFCYNYLFDGHFRDISAELPLAILDYLKGCED
ncbi:MAG: hypothetical protein N4A33_13010 [Bacteriovoracaceae bacterium]|jgi:capsular polysaccharide export protein|nr:hypothetical protein [Bacteriovoracaceae bacterium]